MGNNSPVFSNVQCKYRLKSGVLDLTFISLLDPSVPFLFAPNFSLQSPALLLVLMRDNSEGS